MAAPPVFREFFKYHSSKYVYIFDHFICRFCDIDYRLDGYFVCKCIYLIICVHLVLTLITL